MNDRAIRRWLVLGFAAVGLGAGLLVALGGPRARAAVVDLPDYGRIPDFTLEATDGTLTAAQLDGRIWIADFFFTSCAGICPSMSTQMARVQERFARSGDVVLLSITCDPARDDRDRLTAYAARYGAIAGRWRFATGDARAIQDLAHRVLRLPLRAATDEERRAGEGPIVHSKRFVLVDRRRHVRGYYDGTDPAEVDRLIADVELLLRVPAARR